MYLCIINNNHVSIKYWILKVVLVILFILFPLDFYAQNEVKLIFAGEVNVGNNYNVKNHPIADVDRLFVNVRNELKSGAVSFATLGTVLIDVAGTPNKVNQKGAHRLIRVPQSYASSLNRCGFKVMNLANSHIADYGVEGLQTTSWAMRDNNIEYAGLKAIKEFTIFERDGLKYGFVAFGTSVHAPSMADSTLIRKVVTGLDEQCDIVVVAFSINETAFNTAGGITYASGKNKYMDNARKFAHTCVNAGADVVYGNGHGSLQPIELYDDRLILYGLGNFCTPFGTSFVGESRVAPLIEANFFLDGTFVSGRILSYRQLNANGPQPDATREAVRIIKSQTNHKFPKSLLNIGNDGTIKSDSESAYAVAMRLLHEAERHKGRPYRLGATGPYAFDCSGFTGYIFAKMGIKLQRTAAAQYTMGHAVDRKNLRPGDLVFFTRSSVRGVGHVGIVCSVDKKTGSFRFIHASTSKGVAIDNFSTSAYYIRRYVGARRILD